jgi:hypothetical protein
MRRGRPTSATPTLDVRSDGFSISRANHAPVEVAWTSVTRVITFKRDFLLYDEIAVAFQCEGVPGAVEVLETWDGFVNLINGLDAFLGVEPTWYDVVKRRAFVTALQVIYTRTDPPEYP